MTFYAASTNFKQKETSITYYSKQLDDNHY